MNAFEQNVTKVQAKKHGFEMSHTKGENLLWIDERSSVEINRPNQVEKIDFISKLSPKDLETLGYNTTCKPWKYNNYVICKGPGLYLWAEEGSESKIVGRETVIQRCFYYFRAEPLSLIEKLSQERDD